MKVVSVVILVALALALALAACDGPEPVGEASASGTPASASGPAALETAEPAAAGTPEPTATDTPAPTTVVTPEREAGAESAFDLLVGRLCARLTTAEFQANLQRAVDEGGWVHDYDDEFVVIVHLLEELADRHGHYEIPARLRCPEEWFGFVATFTGKDLTRDLELERLADRACARLREPAVAAWLDGQAGAVADDELVAIFQEAWELDFADMDIGNVMAYHCEDLIERVRAAVALVGGGPEMEQARVRAWQEACPKFEHALSRPEASRAGALALAVKSERSVAERQGIAWETLLIAMTARCPEAAAAVSTLPG